MPEPFKNLIGSAAIDRLADRLAATGPFDTIPFRTACLAPLDGLELKDRVRHVAACLRDYLEPAYPDALARLLRSLPPPQDDTEGVTEAMEWWPVCQFVESYGLDHPDLSVRAMHDLTRRFSCEFAVRPYLARRPAETLSVLAGWTRDPDPHVRRLVSEGTRPRLPWGMRLSEFVRDPEPVIALLERLRDDPEEYVRRSVANNLNDIAKDHPERVVDLAKTWMVDASPERVRLLKRALRTLVKAGHSGALGLFGFEGARVSGRVEVRTPDVRLGEALSFAVELTASHDAALLVDYAVHHVRANGSTTAKVFKWTTRRVTADVPVRLEREHSFRAVTTRRYYPGVHRVEVLVNGASIGCAEFRLTLAG